MIRVSFGTAAVLGLVRARAEADPTTAYLMVGERCGFDCGFCPQAAAASSSVDLLSRVTWPAFSEYDVVPRIVEAGLAGIIRRVCIQVVHSNGALDAARRVIDAITGRGLNGGSAPVPVSVSAHITSAADAIAFLDGGAERVGIPLDAATPGVYRRVKRGSFHSVLSALLETAAARPGRVSTHLIAGLGETEEEMVGAIQAMRDAGVTVGLFAFTPVRGTAMEAVPAPDLPSYRRIQVAHHLISTGQSRVSRMQFESGRIIDYGVDPGRLGMLLRSGDAFRTTGCPFCNRPYYNERPGGAMYNYPRRLSAAETAEAVGAATLGAAGGAGMGAAAG